MSKYSFKKINRKVGLVEQNHLYVTYTNACQCSCPGCRNLGFSDEVMKENLKLDDLILKNSKYFRHIVFGGGEPSYRIPEIVNLIQKIKKRNHQKLYMPENEEIKFTMTTNGSKKLLLELNDVCHNCDKFDRIILSRYHYDDWLNDALFRANGSLMTTYHIDSLCDVLKRKLQLSCLCQRGGIETVDDMEQFVVWAQNIGINDVMFSNYQSDITPDAAKTETDELFKKAKKMFVNKHDFDKTNEIVFSAGYKIEVFEKSDLLALIAMPFEFFMGEEKKFIVSFREFSNGGLQSEEWNRAKKRTYNYSIMPNGEMFSDWSCKNEI